MCLLFLMWGNIDFVQASGCFMSQFVTMLFGDLFEAMNHGKPANEVNWTPMKYGFIFGIMPWILMVFEMIRAN